MTRQTNGTERGVHPQLMPAFVRQPYAFACTWIIGSFYGRRIVSPARFPTRFLRGFLAFLFVVATFCIGWSMMGLFLLGLSAIVLIIVVLVWRKLSQPGAASANT
jgi:hypothetical protein